MLVFDCLFVFNGCSAYLPQVYSRETAAAQITKDQKNWSYETLPFPERAEDCQRKVALGKMLLWSRLGQEEAWAVPSTSHRVKHGVQVRGTRKKRDLPHFHASLSILILLHDLGANNILFLDTFGHIPTIFTYMSLTLSIYNSRSLGPTLLSSCIKDWGTSNVFCETWYMIWHTTKQLTSLATLSLLRDRSNHYQ